MVTSKSTASLAISKQAAAQRQIDAAIRMFLIGEDDLAIYTIAVAALKVLRDIMKKRGSSFVADRHLYMVYGAARALLNNDDAELFEKVKSIAPSLYEVIEQAAEVIRVAEQDGRRRKADELFELTASEAAELAYIKQTDFPANFLKHADRDADSHWPERDFDTERVLLDACDAYFSVMNRLTPEMLVYWTLGLAKLPGVSAKALGLPWAPVAQVLEEADQEEWHSVCLYLLKEKRNVLNDWLQRYFT